MKQVNQNWRNFLLDGAMFIVFLVSTAPRFSGLAIHEWLGLALAAAIITHLLLHWQWIVSIGKRLFGKTTWRSRLNYLLNALLFVAFTVTIATGVLMSREALPLLGLTMPRDRTLELLHHQASDLTVLILGLHVAIHWSWIVGMVRRFWPQRKPALPAQFEEVAR
ncbi:DUF4405 domain-containing protein [Chloroflexus sp.]|uniref:DUF4405 domain-containing protein n=1 Tax=Chloroflexus sp. TaxID=1904827 RepID=UPI00298EFD8D|nr:DUF4405 domain-containing protein [Chloroflexus sp.]MCS6888004.1 DUF4405 domain-containing protein [Chloroflexus sp.]MDW8403410.1 DUF4405 domain-containing protein [Chloroflexus sp.]